MKLDIFNIQGEKTGEFDVDVESLGEDVSPSLLHRVVVSYEANKRQGSACTKTRGDASGSGKKLWKQKGTGRARMGSLRSPTWRGGGVAFGPKPRDYRMKMSKTERRQALRGVIKGKLRDGEVCLVDSFQLPEAKTRVVAAFMKKAGFSGRVAFIPLRGDELWLRASRNICDVNTLPLEDMNALSLLMGGRLVFEKAALEKYLSGVKS
ncbi:MAG: 50S ribosomal protein L4 [Planctomycetes bacterium]|nr:50S ribosomal protein L4 [Planctomycetota bacterium]